MKKKLEKLVNELWPGAYLYKSFCIGRQRYGWIAKPFNHNEIYLGKTLADALEAAEAMTDI